MTKIFILKFITTLLIALFLCTACTTLGNAPIKIGDTEAQTTALLGRPALRYADGSAITLIYPRGPFGQETYVARFGTNGRLSSYEQVLTMQKFGTIRIGKDTKDVIMKTFGPPAETTYLSLPKLEVWSYRYKENNVWDSMMHVHFDQSGLVHKIQNGPDRRNEEREPFPGLLLGI